MGLADGDLYVSGSILSYQQANRMYQNFRAATVPSALQPGALWSDSDDDKIHHRGASATEEILQLTRSADVSPQFATIRLMDAGADHYLDIRCTEELTANKILLLDIADTNRTITLSGNPTLADWFDQGVKVADKPTHAGATFSKTVNWKKGADKASAATLDISALDGNYFDVTGTTDITAISTSGQAGTIIKLHFDGILTIVHDGDDIILPDGKDIYTMAGTELEFIEYVSGKWRCTTSLKAKPVLTNLLSNSGFGFWSQGDDNEGIATLVYDTGAKGGGSTPSVGDSLVGGTSGATAKLISYTTTGSWDTGNAYGTLTLGACTGRFHDDETITFETNQETCIVNQPNSAAGVDLVQNGEFSVDTDPPPGWTAVTATLTTEAGGQVGNCMQVASSGAALGKAYQDRTTVIGKIYKLSLYFKKGTSATGKFMIGITTDEDSIYDSGDLSDAAWTAKTATFEATATTTRITMQTTDATITENSLFDEVSLYEITPCCTGVDFLACDIWRKNVNGQIYRQHNDATYTKDGSFYSAKLVVIGANAYLQWPQDIYTQEWFYKQYRGKIVTLGCWVYTSTADHAKLRIYDGANNDGSCHSGTPGWEWLEFTYTISAVATNVNFSIQGTQAPNVDGSTIIYVSQPMLVFGSSIGEGNYAPKQNEWIYGEKFIPSNKYDNTTSLSTVTYALLNLEADSDGKIPKGIKAVLLHVEATDTGSAAAVDLHIHCRKDSTASRFFTLCFGGRLNDVEAHTGGMQPCSADGDIEVGLQASGAGTLSITRFRFLGVQLN